MTLAFYRYEGGFLGYRVKPIAVHAVVSINAARIFKLLPNLCKILAQGLYLDDENIELFRSIVLGHNCCCG